VEQHLGQFLFGPSLAQRHAQMQAQLGLAPGRDVGDDADQCSGFQIEAGPGPQRAEHRFGRHVDELFHDRVAVDLPSGTLDRRVAHQLAPHCRPFSIKFALRHRSTSLSRKIGQFSLCRRS
jgi:hypothetical protein